MGLADNSYLPLLHVIVNWHQWFEFVYRNVGIASFAVLVTAFVLSWIYAQKLLRAIHNELNRLPSVIPNVRSDIDETKAAVFDTHHAIEERISDLRQDIDKSLERQELLYGELRNALKALAAKSGGDALREPTDEAELAEFPSSVGSYLRHVEQKKLTMTEARSDVLHDGNLMPAASGEFVIVSNEGSDLAVPQVARFSSGEDFTAYFRDYFECDSPSGGEVWITRPAVVRNDDVKGGWVVVKKGKLEVRQ